MKEIRNRPYAWASQRDVPKHNCYYKGVELLQRLGVLGFAVRGRVGETCFDLTRRYSQEEQIAYQKEWFDPAYAQRYFTRIKPCAEALNAYYNALRQE